MRIGNKSRFIVIFFSKPCLFKQGYYYEHSRPYHWYRWWNIGFIHVRYFHPIPVVTVPEFKPYNPDHCVSLSSILPPRPEYHDI